MDYNQVVDATNRIILQYTVRLTVRQIYYRLISPPFQLFANTVQNYKTFDRVLTKAREKSDVDWRKIEDRSRSTYGPRTDWFGGLSLRFSNEIDLWKNPEDFLDYLEENIVGDFYDRAYWAEQPKHVEVWVEKDALSSLFLSATEKHRVLVFPSRGYSSFTKIMEAAGRFPKDKPTLVLHFADHDPSGLDMSKDIENRLVSYGADDVEVKRIALTIGQVQTLGLAPNPTKAADSRSPRYVEEFGDECWELDAMPPDILETTIGDAVSAEIDQAAWTVTSQTITEERTKLKEAMSKHIDMLSEYLAAARDSYNGTD